MLTHLECVLASSTTCAGFRWLKNFFTPAGVVLSRSGTCVSPFAVKMKRSLNLSPRSHPMVSLTPSVMVALSLQQLTA
jgi:hypothetical protein